MIYQMIETDVFNELNTFGPDDAPTEDLIEKLPGEGNERRGFFSRLFGRRVSSCYQFWLFFANDTGFSFWFCSVDHLLLTELDT